MSCIPLSVPRSLLPVAVAAAIAVLAGCSSTPVDRTENWSPNRIYAEGKDELKAGGFDRAVQLFEKLEGRAAGTPLAQQAQLEKAYAQYRSGEKVQALATLDRFMKLHPASPALDYAIYMKGVINFNEDLGLFAFISRQDLSERDQNAAKESFESFKELVTRFPDSRYTPDARERMTYIVNSLAGYEVHVARYYYRRGAYLAAINRAQQAITDYRGVPALEEALFIMVKSYEALGMKQLQEDSMRVMQATYPNSEFITQGFRKNSDPWWKIW